MHHATAARIVGFHPVHRAGVIPPSSSSCLLFKMRQPIFDLMFSATSFAFKIADIHDSQNLDVGTLSICATRCVAPGWALGKIVCTI